jgi:tetratricopeptide (TPR) repeat protein
MRVISQRQQKQQLLLQLAEGKLNNFVLNKFIKAGISACLFLFLVTQARAKQFTFDPKEKASYQQVLNLNFDRNNSPDETSVQQAYINALGEALELLITEDKSNYVLYEERFENRLEKKWNATPEAIQFLEAELHLQWSFVYLKFGHEFDAASHLHEAYKIAQRCRRKFPKYTAIRKTTGLLEIMIGSVPEKYSWLLNVLGMKGSVSRGLEDMAMVISSDSPLSFETKLLSSVVHGFVFQKPDVGVTEVTKLLDTDPDNRATLLLGAVMAMKNSDSETALGLLTKLEEAKGFPLSFTKYLTGEILLHKGEYEKSIRAFESFLSEWKGINYIKDSYYKIGLCFHLQQQSELADKYFQLAKVNGESATEADKSAARTLSDEELPNIVLSKARYAMDGGYYDRAFSILWSIKKQDLKTRRDEVEYYYRKARLEHKTNHIAAARLFYEQTIDMAQSEHWYFAPNSCLQLGYIYAAEKKMNEARTYFEKAISYKHHEYKNSIDSKARSALNEMKRAH